MDLSGFMRPIEPPFDDKMFMLFNLFKAMEYPLAGPISNWLKQRLIHDTVLNASYLRYKKLALDFLPLSNNAKKHPRIYLFKNRTFYGLSRIFSRPVWGISCQLEHTCPLICGRNITLCILSNGQSIPYTI